MSKHNLIAMGAGIAAIIMIVVVYGFYGHENSFSGRGSQTASSDASLEDPKSLVGYAQYVFAGKVISIAGHEPRFGLAHSQYEVEVLYNIKGSLSGRVIVDQTEEVGLGDRKLTPGSTYLISARYIPEVSPYYHAGSGWAFVTLITNDRELSQNQLVSKIEKSPRTRELLEAYPNEIVRDRDIETGYARNSFSQLTPEEQRAVREKISSLSN